MPIVPLRLLSLACLLSVAIPARAEPVEPAPAAVPTASNEILDAARAQRTVPRYVPAPGFVLPEGPVSLNWDSVKREFRVPAWLQDGKFGIFIHWGVYTVPAHHNEWYARHMYSNPAIMQWHRDHFGPQDQFGYKDFIPLFKAERFDPAAWATLFKEAGATFVVPAAEHHDRFAMWDSKITRWNAKQMGPKRDVIGELSKAVRARGMRFGVSNHRMFAYDFMTPADKSLKTDLFDPANAEFYGPLATEQKTWPTQEFCNDWLARTLELVDLYQPDFLWFDWDGTGAENPVKLQFAAYYFNRAKQWGTEVAFSQKGETFLFGTGISSHEKIQRMPKTTTPHVWMVDDVISDRPWSYVETPKPMNYRTAREIIDELATAVSRNGTMMLNISPKADGSIPPEQQAILRAIGGWLKVNGQGIYGTRPWAGATEREGVRFTAHGDDVYVIVLHEAGAVLDFPEFAIGKFGRIRTVLRLGSTQGLPFTQGESGLSFPAEAGAGMTLPLVFKVSQ